MVFRRRRLRLVGAVVSAKLNDPLKKFNEAYLVV